MACEAAPEPCRCGACCWLGVLADAADAGREPLIRERGLAMTDGAGDARWHLNPEGGPCAFLSQDGPAASCTIYGTRPQTCRRFDCLKWGGQLRAGRAATEEARA
jgi:Fe-S-cluster containining protein